MEIKTPFLPRKLKKLSIGVAVKQRGATGGLERAPPILLSVPSVPLLAEGSPHEKLEVGHFQEGAPFGSPVTDLNIVFMPFHFSS